MIHARGTDLDHPLPGPGPPPVVALRQARGYAPCRPGRPRTATVGVAVEVEPHVGPDGRAGELVFDVALMRKLLG